jgi:hypothetical protein
VRNGECHLALVVLAAGVLGAEQRPHASGMDHARGHPPAARVARHLRRRVVTQLARRAPGDRRGPSALRRWRGAKQAPKQLCVGAQQQAGQARVLRAWAGPCCRCAVRRAWLCQGSRPPGHGRGSWPPRQHAVRVCGRDGLIARAGVGRRAWLGLVIGCSMGGCGRLRGSATRPVAYCCGGLPQRGFGLARDLL